MYITLLLLYLFILYLNLNSFLAFIYNANVSTTVGVRNRGLRVVRRVAAAIELEQLSACEKCRKPKTKLSTTDIVATENHARVRGVIQKSVLPRGNLTLGHR